MRLNRKLISLYLVLLSTFSLQVLCEDEISIIEIEPNSDLISGEKIEICIQCEDSPQHEDEIIPFTVSLLVDFTYTLNLIPYRYYNEPKITYISPRSGPKDDNTKVDVFLLFLPLSKEK